MTTYEPSYETQQAVKEEYKRMRKLKIRVWRNYKQNCIDENAKRQATIALPKSEKGYKRHERKHRYIVREKECQLTP